jgi:hypothetical protein
MYPHPGVLETLQYDEYQKFMNLPADHLKTEFLVMGCDTEDSIAPSIVLRTMNSLHIIFPTFNSVICYFSEHRSLKIYLVLARS